MNDGPSKNVANNQVNDFTVEYNENAPLINRLPMTLEQLTYVTEKIALWKRLTNQLPLQEKNNFCQIIRKMPDTSLPLTRDTEVLYFYTTIASEMNYFGRVCPASPKMAIVLSYIRTRLNYPGCYSSNSQELIQSICNTGLHNDKDIVTFMATFKDCDPKNAKLVAAFFLFYDNTLFRY
jgi:hypothetical protein